MLGPHQSPFYFCINQFHKSHHLELRNLIHIYFKTFLKIKGDVKIACQKERWQQILLNWDFWVILKTLEMNEEL